MLSRRDVEHLMSFFRYHLEVIYQLNTLVLAKTFFYVQVAVGKIEALYVSLTNKLLLVEPLVIGTLTLNFYFVTPKFLDYMQNQMMLLEQHGHILVKVLATAT